jgi:iron-sulfur cluster insertion protein
MIDVTEMAKQKIQEYLEDEDEKFLRVFVEGGGCSGMQYGFDLEEKPEEEDFQLPFNDFTLLVDSISFQYLQGATIDYAEDLMGAAFTIKNPNAQTTCGCGSSFSVQ